ncbi:very-long-chain (3R)-3-hydroxyacyl-CoA dehydratase 4 isoform X2 [Python bivittatus]|uniref:Very-long-chain (3R)-3-hydroxyacyl-CoA dehydratase n=1 Tax=Python bivittatus TaxID=176946 RepID=A0A9F5IRV9_PYTBI|nr:very-long-chain (3R)-3-hydroxyacyl-CoA dehydratase 4 isoform X2 [Python bivittatus]
MNTQPGECRHPFWLASEFLADQPPTHHLCGFERRKPFPARLRVQTWRPSPVFAVLVRRNDEEQKGGKKEGTSSSSPQLSVETVGKRKARAPTGRARARKALSRRSRESKPEPSDSVADTFHSIGLVMRICQLASILELLHIWLGIEKDQFFPRFLQITERIVILFVAIASQEEVQGKYIVCVLFFLWSCIDVIRYTYCILLETGIYFQGLTWLYHSLWIPFYPLLVLAQAFAIYESLPHFETSGTYSIRILFPFDLTIYFPYVLKMYMAILFGGTYFIVQYLYMERKTHLGSYNIKEKRS